MNGSPSQLASRAILSCATILIFGFSIWSTCTTIHWPLVGDASLTHYAVFLLDRGSRAYRSVHDVNLPGSYLGDWLVMSTLGWSALAWRIYDILLTAVAAAAMVFVSPRDKRLAGLLAASLLVLIHLRDGIVQLGQRDLELAALELLAYAAISKGQARNVWSLLIAGLLLGLAVSFKPTALLAAVVLLVYVLMQRERAFRDRRRSALFLLGGLCLIPALCFLWLMHTEALAGLMLEMSAMVAHASGNRPPLVTMLARLTSPIVGFVLASIVLLFSRRMRARTPQANVLLGLVVAGALQFLAQGKGYAYHRYPFLLFALLLWAIVSYEAIEEGPLLKAISIAFVLYAAFVMTPRLHAKIAAYDAITDPFGSDLTKQIAQRGGGGLDGRIQCLDTFSGCIRVLYQLRLQEATGLMYDENLWTSRHQETTTRLRAQFLDEFTRTPPCLIVMTPQNYPLGPDGYDKIDRWPEFAEVLKSQFKLVYEFKPVTPVHWEGEPRMPLGYRLYQSGLANCADVSLKP